VIVLGFDTSTHATAVALRLADGSTIEARDDPPAGAHPGHATRLLPIANELLARAGVRWSAVERVAVGVGPGTFTGLRVGVATARGLAQSLSAELVAVSSLQALAIAALAPGEPVPADAPDAVLAVIDARRGEVFAAAYTRAHAGAPQDLGLGGALQELLAPAALAPTALSELVASASPSRWLAVGDGAVRYRAQLESAGIPTPPDRSPLHLVDAAAICELGASGTPMSLHEIDPDYQRRPDAELALIGTDTAAGPVS
jgi:tRNA threonylcarbamoyladenosine biosynthesis protein TsaB